MKGKSGAVEAVTLWLFFIAGGENVTVLRCKAEKARTCNCAGFPALVHVHTALLRTVRTVRN